MQTDAGCLAASWGGLEGFTPPHNLRRGQRLPTDSVHTPAPRVSAGLRFAVILLSKAMDVGRDHLIHREAVPLPLRGEGLNAREREQDCEYRAPLYTPNCSYHFVLLSTQLESFIKTFFLNYR